MSFKKLTCFRKSRAFVKASRLKIYLYANQLDELPFAVFLWILIRQITCTPKKEFTGNKKKMVNEKREWMKNEEEQIAFALKQAKVGITVTEICRKLGV
jgi:hypothetical protein